MPKINPTPSRKILVIVGPTASGKSDLGIKIAKKFNGEIISADSRQVYRGMNLGTGKVERDSIKYKVVSIKEKKEDSEYYSKSIRHHLIDVASPKRQFTADDFKKLGQKAVDDILSRGKIPIIVGGTGFYIDVLLGRMSIAEVPPNKKLRTLLDKLTVEHLFKMLQKLDPQRAKTIEPKNKRRLIRALEIVATLGKVPHFDTKYHIPYTIYQTLWIGLRPKNLETRIKKRLDKRLKQGMVKEVKTLHKQGVSWKRLDDLGLEYRWISRFLIKNVKRKTQNYNLKFKNSEEYGNLAREIIKYSKRQMTWFKINKDIKWLAQASAMARASIWVEQFLQA